MMLHSLNAVRVLAEFWVVHLHLSPAPSGMLFFVTRDLMSFFFVLSGFVVMHTHAGDDLSGWKAKREFWWRRFSKLYPTFALFWAIALVFYVTGPEFQLKDTPCHYVQLVMANTWMGCRVNIMNQPSWYVTVLWWLWVVFPWVLPVVRAWKEWLPWTQIILINAAAMAIVTPMFSGGYWGYATMPVFRLPEFLIGCIAEIIVQRRLHWAWPAGCGKVMLMFYVNQFYMLRRTPACDPGGYDTECIICSSAWSVFGSNPFTDPCMLVWSYACLNKFALFYAVFIHWLASSEVLDTPGRFFRFMETNTVLQTLSTFSLQLYLGHSPIRQLIIQVLRWFLYEKQLELDMMCIAVYGASYAVKLYVHPWMDVCMEALGRCCATGSKSVQDMEEQGSV